MSDQPASTRSDGSATMASGPASHVEKRRHPRHLLPSASSYGTRRETHRVRDISRAGLAFYGGERMAPGTALTLMFDSGDRIAASVVNSMETAFISSFIERSLRFQIHCRFDHELDAAGLDAILAGNGHLRVAPPA